MKTDKAIMSKNVYLVLSNIQHPIYQGALRPEILGQR